MLFTDEIVIRAFAQGAITLPETLMVLDTGSDGAQGGKHQPSPTSTQRDADMANQGVRMRTSSGGTHSGLLMRGSDMKTGLTECAHCHDELASCNVREIEPHYERTMTLPVCDDCCDTLMDHGWEWAGTFIQPEVPPIPFRM